MKSVAAMFYPLQTQSIMQQLLLAKLREMQPTLRAFLFDMDGVLYDSMSHHAEAWMRTSADYGITATPNDFYRYEGQTGAQTINVLFQRQWGCTADDAKVKEVYACKCRHFESLGPTTIMAGAPEVLAAVGRLGWQRVVVTGSGQASLIGKLEANFPGVFSEERIVSAKDTPAGRGKPMPDPYLMGLRKAGDLRPDQAVVVENAPLGVRAAHAAGIFTIAVNTGPLSDAELACEGADVVLHGGMVELAEVLRQL
jgi:beta-phosphoglucomutase-like phosphatase (HAD superfamily)